MLHSFSAPFPKGQITAFTWAHNDTSVIIAAGGQLAVGNVVRDVPKLSQLVNYKLWSSMGKTTENLDSLRLPPRETQILKEFNHHIIKVKI